MNEFLPVGELVHTETGGVRLGAILSIKTIIPIIQKSYNDCGACCARMILRFHGVDATVETLALALMIDEVGTTALALVSVLRQFGVEALGADIRGLNNMNLPHPSIIHWHGRHFVVLERADRRRAVVVDPRVGRVSFPWPEFWRAATGVAIIVAAPHEIGSRPRSVLY